MSTTAQRRHDLPLDAIAAFCSRWGVSEFALFGSALRDDFDAASDVDVLVQFREGARYTLFDMLLACGKLVRFTQGLTADTFQKNELVQSAAIRSERHSSLDHGA